MIRIPKSRMGTWLMASRVLAILALVIKVNLVIDFRPCHCSRVRGDLASIKTAVMLFKVKNSRYPRSMAELTRPDAKGEVFIDELPPDPWGGLYILEPRSPRPPLIWSLGADRAPGGEGNDADRCSEKDGLGCPILASWAASNDTRRRNLDRR